MSKLISTFLVAVALALAAHGTTYATGHGRSCHEAAGITAPAPLPAQARANAYRSYSYEPAAPITRSYPAYGSYRSYRTRSNVPTYLQGGSKALGRY